MRWFRPYSMIDAFSFMTLGLFPSGVTTNPRVVVIGIVTQLW